MVGTDAIARQVQVEVDRPGCGEQSGPDCSREEALVDPRNASRHHPGLDDGVEGEPPPAPPPLEPHAAAAMLRAATMAIGAIRLTMRPYDVRLGIRLLLFLAFWIGLDFASPGRAAGLIAVASTRASRSV